MADVTPAKPITTGPAIGLSWDGRGDGTRTVQRADSVWAREIPDPLATFRGLTGFEWHGTPGDPLAAVAMAGDRLDALDYLARTAPGYFALVHVELPRTVLDDKALQFRADDAIPDRVCLEVSEALVAGARRLARPDGILCVLCGDEDAGLARVLCDELLGRSCRVGSAVWQKAYAPRNTRGMKTLTAVHDHLLLYAVSPTLLRPVGLRTGERSSRHPDGDPRGPWIAEHKGAQSRRESTDFDAFRPPYRWELEYGELPPGIWRVSPMSGVIWGERVALAGEYRFGVVVRDSDGAEASRELRVTIADSGEPPNPQPPQGILDEIGHQKGELRIVTEALPVGVAGHAYYATLEAAGGNPYRGDPVRPKQPRYWEFADRTFAQKLAEDRVQFGRRGDAIGSIKQYGAPDEEQIENQTTWWAGRKVASGRRPEVLAGYSQDARKHLLALQRSGALQQVPASAKPEMLMGRLIDIFAPPDGPVLEVSAESGEMTAVAIKRGRPAFCLTGGDDRGRGYAADCLIPRLSAVIDGRDRDLTEDDGTPLSTDVYVPYEGGGRVLWCEVGPILATYDPSEELFELRLAPGPELADAVLSTLGYLPDVEPLAGFHAGSSFDGCKRAVCLPPDRFLTPDVALELADASVVPLTIAYFRADGLERGLLEAAGARFSCIRIPYDLPR